MLKTPEFIRNRVLRKFKSTIMPDTNKHPSVKTIGDYQKFDNEKLDAVRKEVEFCDGELPIILCWVSKFSWALITTHKVVSLYEGKVNDVLVQDCEGCTPINPMNPPVKIEGTISPYIVNSSKDIGMTMELPSGSAAIAFQGAVLVLSRLDI